MMRGKRTFAVIRAVYENRHSPEDFVRELDFVLGRNVTMVIIEPEDLGEVTWRWIRTGNFLHKTTVLSGMAALLSTGVMLALGGMRSISGGNWFVPLDCQLSAYTSLHLAPSIALSFVSAFSAGVYAVFWQWDPCAKYQVAASLAALPPGVAAAALGLSSSGTSPLTYSTSSQPDSAEAQGSHHDSHDEEDMATVSPASGRTLLTSSTATPTCAACSNGPPVRPVVLIRRDDFHRKIVHNAVAVSAVVVVGLALCKWRPSLLPLSLLQALSSTLP